MRNRTDWIRNKRNKSSLGVDWAFSQHVSEMTVLTRPLNADGWQLNYDVVAKQSS